MTVLEPQEVEAFAVRMDKLIDAPGLRGQARLLVRDIADAGAKRAIEQCADIADQHNSVEGIAQRIAAAIRGLLTGEVGEPRKGKR